jgi:electron transport complex protein RnfG
MNETVKLALILFLITAISATVLAVSNDITAPKIAEADALKDENAKREILPDGEEFKPLDEGKLKAIQSSHSNISEIYEAYSSGHIVGYTIKMTTNGYGGEIEFMIGVSTEGRIMGINILNHGETPGLGANITKAYFTNSFKNKSTDGEITASKEPSGDTEVQALTSATRSTDAILDGVNTALKVYNEELAN